MPYGYDQSGSDPDQYTKRSGQVQSQSPASQVVKAVNESETYRMLRGDFQQAAVLESNKRAYSKRMGIGNY